MLSQVTRKSPRLSLSSFRLYCSSEPFQPVIPARVERGPTDILEALASTVGKDFTAPHYRYHDDPWLIPYRLDSKRGFSLAKESGRNAAKFIMNQHPDLFEHNRIEADPPATAFQPRARYNRDNVTLELLQNLGQSQHLSVGQLHIASLCFSVSSFQVEDSMLVYQLLKEKKKEIPAELYESLLQLVSFYNEQPALEEGDQTRGIVSEKVDWTSGGFVETAYSEGSEASPAERMALLLGQGKHGGKVWLTFKECQANNDHIPLEAFNLIISRINKDSSLQNAVEQIQGFLQEMKTAGIAPNNETLISVLTVLDGFSKTKEHDSACRRALDFLAEFRVLELEFSLGVYKKLLDIYVPMGKARNSSSILAAIMEEIEGREFYPAQHQMDFWFFPTAMRVCNVQNNAKLAWKVDDFLNSGPHALLLSDFMMEQIYYTNFLSVVLQNDSLETAMGLYNKLVPHSSTPMYNFYGILLNTIHNTGGLQYLAKVWDDLILSEYGSASKENQYKLTSQMMQILKSNNPANYDLTGLSEVYVNITNKVFAHLVDGKDSKKLFLRFNNAAAGICNDALVVALREGDFELAARIVKFCVEEKNVMPGNLSDESLDSYVKACVSLEEREKVLEVVEYAVDVDSSAALQLGLTVTEHFQLDSEQRDYLNKLFASHTKWVNI